MEEQTPQPRKLGSVQQFLEDRGVKFVDKSGQSFVTSFKPPPSATEEPSSQPDTPPSESDTPPSENKK